MPEPQPPGSPPHPPEDITLSQDSPTMLQSHPSSIPMPESDDQTFSQNPATELQDPIPNPSVMSIDEWLNKLRSSDRAFYNIMAMEVWSLAKSMDSIVPGFWSRFMVNRRTAMQEFVERRRNDESAAKDPE
jgi:hypothetical protein